MTLLSSTTLGQSGLGSDDNEKVLTAFPKAPALLEFHH